MTVTAPTRSLLALLALVSTLALNAPDAEARRFGGGRSIGMSHSTSSPTHAPHHDTHHDAAPDIVYRPAPLPSLRYQTPLPPSAPATSFRSTNYGSDTTQAVTRAEAMLRAESLAARRQRAQVGAAAPSDPGAEDDAARYLMPRNQAATQQDAAPRYQRVADPRFARITDNVAPSRPCEFKPVMSDDDYIVCGANPPSFPAGR